MAKAPTEPPLWFPEDQPSRLAELVGKDQAARDLPLRRDVRNLGLLLGRVLRSQSGHDLYATEETLRRLAIRHREHLAAGQPDQALAILDEARELIAELPLDEAYLVVKAFATFFELTNLAESNHRKRRQRAQGLQVGQHDKAGSLRATLERMRRAGLDSTQALQALRRIEVMPVFTAHPTEVARRVIRFKRQRIAGWLEELDRLPLAVPVAARLEQSIQAEITGIWQSDEVRRSQPSVRDEIVTGLDHYPASLIGPLDGFYRDLATAWQEVFDVALDRHDLPTVVRFGSWTGGDRDGNPFVTAACTRTALEEARSIILQHYRRQLDQLRRILTVSACRIPPSPTLDAALHRYSEQFPDATAALAHLPQCETYRRFVGYILHRLEAMDLDPPGSSGYPNVATFFADLEVMRVSLRQNRGAELADQWLLPLQRQVRTFGFHLHALDIRQHAHVHQQAVADLQAGGSAPGTPPAAATRELLETLRALAEFKRQFPPRGAAQLHHQRRRHGPRYPAAGLAHGTGRHPGAGPRGTRATRG